MKPYQLEYLSLVRAAAQQIRPSADELEPEEFVEASRRQKREARRAIDRGTVLLRERLFPVLGNIFAVSDEDARDLEEFAAELTRPGVGNDVELGCRIHQALLSRARQAGDRDGVIRELYYVGMTLHSLESMLSPNSLRLYTARMRMCFTESASYFETDYEDIKDPETRGYIHRSMGNIALSYVDNSPASAKAKLAAITRSLRILSDPEIQAMTPSLPWEQYIYKTHQECTTLLNFLRSGQAGPEAFAQVLESAQIVQDRQTAAARERGIPLQPRWQYAYMAARYHCGAMLLPELLDGLYGLSTSKEDDDMSHEGMFSHVTAPALYIEYSRGLTGGRAAAEAELRIPRMTHRLLAWLVRFPSGVDEQVSFAVRQFIYAYRELPGCMSFYEALQNVLAACCPTLYARGWIVSHMAERMALWAASDCPGRLAGIPGFATAEDVSARSGELLSLVRRAGRVYDAGMIHFVNFEASACRGLISDEEALLQLHAHCGAMLLSRHPSTAVFADVAKGHHCHFDGRGGYPRDFSILDSPMRPLIALISAADTLSAAVEEISTRMRPYVTFDQALAQLREGSGTAYAPFVAELLTPARCEELRLSLEEWRHEAYLHMYNRRAAMRSM